MSETRQLDLPTAPQAPREITRAAKNTHTATGQRRTLFTITASLWLGAMLLSGGAVHEATAAEPAKATAATSTPQANPIKVLWVKQYVPKETKDWPEGYPFEPESSYLPQVRPESATLTSDGLVVTAAIRDRRGGFDKLLGVSFDGDPVWETVITEHVPRIVVRDHGIMVNDISGHVLVFYEADYGSGPGLKTKRRMILAATDRTGRKLWEKTYSRVGEDVLYPEYARIVGDNIEIVGKSRGWSLADFVAAERLVLSNTGQVLQPLAPFLKVPAPTAPQDNGQEQIYWCRRTAPAGDGWQEFCSMRPDKEITFHFDSKGQLEWQFPVKSTRAANYKFKELFVTDGGYELLGTLNESSSPLDRDKPTSLVIWRLDAKGSLLKQQTFPLRLTGNVCCVVRSGTSGYLLVFEPLQSALAQGGGEGVYEKNRYYAGKKDNIYLLAIQRNGTMTERLALPKVKHGNPTALIASDGAYYLIAGNGAPNRVALHITKIRQ